MRSLGGRRGRAARKGQPIRRPLHSLGGRLPRSSRVLDLQVSSTTADRTGAAEQVAAARAHMDALIAEFKGASRRRT
jgi:hypothetical protein